MPSSKTSSLNPILAVIAVAVVISASVFAVRSLTKETVEIRTAQVGYQDIINTVSTNGKVEPVDEFQAHALGPGQVKKIYVAVGEKVRAGDLLIKLDDTDAVQRLASCRANLAAAQNTLANLKGNGSKGFQIGLTNDLRNAQLQQQQAMKDVASLESLQARGAASAAELASAQQRLATANVALQTINQRSAGQYSGGDISEAEQQVANAQAVCAADKTNYDNANIRSPISGTVYSVPVSVYDFVPAGDDLLDVADLNKLRVRAYFDEPEIGKLAPGQPVKIVWDAKPNLAWHGHIDLAPSTVISYGTRSVGECVITVDDAHGDLQPNSNVTVNVTTLQRNHVLSIPREALRTDAGKNFVYLVSGGKLVRTPVQIGAALNLTRAEIVSGIKEGDIVALDATTNHDLSDGLAVKTVK